MEDQNMPTQFENSHNGDRNLTPRQNQSKTLNKKNETLEGDQQESNGEDKNKTCEENETHEADQNEAHREAQNVTYEEKNEDHREDQNVTYEEKNEAHREAQNVTHEEKNEDHREDQNVTHEEKNEDHREDQNVTYEEKNEAHREAQNVTYEEENEDHREDQNVTHEEKNEAHREDQNVTHEEKNEDHREDHNVTYEEKNEDHREDQNVTYEEKNEAHREAQNVTYEEKNEDHREDQNVTHEEKNEAHREAQNVTYEEKNEDHREDQNVTHEEKNEDHREDQNVTHEEKNDAHEDQNVTNEEKNEAHTKDQNVTYREKNEAHTEDQNVIHGEKNEAHKDQNVTNEEKNEAHREYQNVTHEEKNQAHKEDQNVNQIDEDQNEIFEEELVDDSEIATSEEEYECDDYDYYNDTDDFVSDAPKAEMHSLLAQDIERVKQKYGEKAITHKSFEEIGDIDVDLHIPCNHFDNEVAKAWRINNKEDIIVRLHMDLIKYFDVQPNVEVFQLSKPDRLGVVSQMKSILHLFLANNTFGNDVFTVKPPESNSATVSKQEQKRKGKSMASKPQPSIDEGFLAMIYEYCCQRLDSLNEFCVICDEPHLYKNTMLKPAVCSRQLCLFAFQALGVMSEATEDISTGPEVVDLLITMAKAACKSNRRSMIFNPYPSVVDPMNSQRFALNPADKKFERCAQAFRALDMHTLCGYQGAELKKFLDKQDILACPLLQWLIVSNRSHIVKLPENRQLSFMKTPHQFLLMSSPPAKEALFQKYKRQYGSTFAFHGSRTENWHAIIRNGLMNASGTKYQLNGAAIYGNGIYLSPSGAISFGYCYDECYRNTQAKSYPTGSPFLKADQGVICIALCEVITSRELTKHPGEEWVMPDPDKVCTRFFFVYDDIRGPGFYHLGGMFGSQVHTQRQPYRSAIRSAVENN